MKKYGVVLSILFVIFASIVGGWIILNYESSHHHAKIASSEAPAFYLNGVTEKTFNSEGTLAYSIYAKKIASVDAGKKTLFTEPHVKVWTKNGQIWVIWANQGTSTSGNKEIILTGQVHVKQEDNHNEGMLLITDFLTIYPDRSYAETEEIVHVTRGTAKVTGKGMTANLKTGEFVLKSNTTGFYQP